MANVKRITHKIAKYIEDLLLGKYPNFTGKLEFNFKEGKLKDCLEVKRTKFEEEGK